MRAQKFRFCRAGGLKITSETRARRHSGNVGVQGEEVTEPPTMSSRTEEHTKIGGGGTEKDRGGNSTVDTVTFSFMGQGGESVHWTSSDKRRENVTRRGRKKPWTHQGKIQCTGPLGEKIARQCGKENKRPRGGASPGGGHSGEHAHLRSEQGVGTR